MIEVIALACSFTNPGKHRITGVLNGDIADQFHHVDRFANTGTAKQTNFTAFGKRANQVNNLDAGFQASSSNEGASW